MSTPLLLELFGGFLAACMALWFVALSRPAYQPAAAQSPANALWITTGQAQRIRSFLEAYVLKPGVVASIGLLLLRLAIGVMMIHHGHEKLADPQQFANTYVASLHLPFPLFFAYAAGFSELIGSWLVILGLLTPVGALALTGTMTVAAYQHILTAGLNIYVLELVVLYLGGSLALLLVGPGRFSFDAGMLPGLLVKPTVRVKPEISAPSEGISGLTPAYVQINASNSTR
jgi:putative oxidoreductase